MPVAVLFDDAFAAEFVAYDRAVQRAIMKYVGLLQERGHQLGMPYAHTLDRSKFPNMKELRLTVRVEWRVAFAFDPDRNAILLCAGAKGGSNEERFYKALIRTADARFEAHLKRMDKEKDSARQR